MRVLVTGPRGFVGARIMDELGRDAVPAPSLRSADEEDVRRIVDAARPDLIIHTAAISDISTCEKDPQGSYRANVEIPVWLARTGVKCVMFSTDQVYSGCIGEGPYSEEETAPSNLYSRHKLEMEQRTLDINPDTVLLRATWMYDMPKYGVPNRGNFLVNMLRQTDIAFSASQQEAIIKCMDMAARVKPYGTNPIFIFDPSNKTNRPVKGYQDNALIYWPIYPEKLRQMFTKAFTEGLTSPNKRVTEPEWIGTPFMKSCVLI